MILFPAIDLFEGKAVRLFKGDYAQMTVYSEHPEEIGKEFAACGATHAHLVDLEGARSGETPNLETVKTYLSAGLDRVILGTAAVEDPAFLREAVNTYGEKIAVGADVRDGFIAVKGWTEKSALHFMDFCKEMESIGVKTLICTDMSRDGAMRGTNREMYRELSEELGLQITASGGVSSLEDVESLRRMNLYGAIIGKAYYTGDIDLKKALEVAR